VSAARASSVHTFCIGDLGRQAIKKIDKHQAAYFICLIFYCESKLQKTKELTINRKQIV
jgi:hypothetical protein